MRSLENLKIGLNNYAESCRNLETYTMHQLLVLYGNLSVLIDKSMRDYSKEIAYPAQDLQELVEREVQRRFKATLR